MEGLLNRAADGSIGGIRLWYTKLHAGGCTRCGNYLARLGETIHKLRGAREMGPQYETVVRLEATIPREAEG